VINSRKNNIKMVRGSSIDVQIADSDDEGVNKERRNDMAVINERGDPIRARR